MREGGVPRGRVARLTLSREVKGPGVGGDSVGNLDGVMTLLLVGRVADLHPGHLRRAADSHLLGGGDLRLPAGWTEPVSRLGPQTSRRSQVGTPQRGRRKGGWFTCASRRSSSPRCSSSCSTAAGCPPGCTAAPAPRPRRLQTRHSHSVTQGGAVGPPAGLSWSNSPAI